MKHPRIPRIASLLIPILAAILIVIGIVAVAGCSPDSVSSGGALAPGELAQGHAANLGGKITSAANEINAAGKDIVATASAGQQVTPQEAKTRLDPYWFRLIGSGQKVMAHGESLALIRHDVDDLKGEIHAQQQQMQLTLSALDEQKQGRTKDNKEWEAKLVKANSKWESMFRGMFRTISWLAIISIGISVALGFLLHDFRISVAGGAGGMAVVIACMIVGQVQAWLPWLTGGLLAITALWIGVETYLRGSFKEAIRTHPFQDVKDLLDPRRNAPTPQVPPEPA